MVEITISKREEGQKLLRFLNRYLPKAGSGFLHKMLRKKNITVNEKKTEGGYVLREGDQIRIFFSDETLAHFQGEPSQDLFQNKNEKMRARIRVLFESEDILLFHKPAGLLTQKAKKEDDSLNDYLLDYCKEKGIMDSAGGFRPSVVNRLDRNTSGIVVCGISMHGLQRASEAFRDHTVDKYYLAMVTGQMTGKDDLKSYLVKDREKNTVRITSEPMPNSSVIETAYEVLSATREASLLKIRLITGKSHQIRAQLAALGHPLYGDGKYGDRKANEKMRSRVHEKILMLHCYQVKTDDGLFPDTTDPVSHAFHKALKAFGVMRDDLLTE